MQLSDDRINDVAKRYAAPEAAVVLIRVGTGVLLACHGVQKLTHWLGGEGLDAAGADMDRDGLRGGRTTAAVAGVSQSIAGLLLAVGAVSPLAVASATGVMTVAAVTKAPHGLWSQHDGSEYPLVLAVAAAAIGIAGPTRWTVDRWLPGAPRWGLLGAPAVGVGAGAGLVAARLLKR